MQAAVDTYQEVTPSGEGIRIWGLAEGDPLHTKFTLDIDGKKIAAELFRRTNKALTITGYRINTVRDLTNIDRVFDWALVWGQRRKAAAQTSTQKDGGNGFDSNGCSFSIDQIEQIVREGAGRKRSIGGIPRDRRSLCRLWLAARTHPGASAAISRRHWLPLPP